MLSRTQVISFCKAEPGCQSLTLCDPVPLPLLSTFDSLGMDLVHFVKHTGVNRRGVGAVSKTKGMLPLEFFGYIFLCFAFLLDSLADVN